VGSIKFDASSSNDFSGLLLDDVSLTDNAVLSGTATATTMIVTCANTTTQASVKARLRKGGEWDCLDSGLPISSGDGFKVVITGKFQPAAPVRSGGN
jgi:hypothetical protein